MQKEVELVQETPARSSWTWMGDVDRGDDEAAAWMSTCFATPSHLSDTEPGFSGCGE
jgi:hypothetical protein